MSISKPYRMILEDGRVEGFRISKKIVYGNSARRLPPERRATDHTHEWTLYVRPYTKEDLSTFIRKVAFQLHPSFSDQMRVVKAPPFELQETGWGEFKVRIRIYFVDTAERPVDIYHILRLRGPPGGDASIIIVSERCEELIFQQPRLVLYKGLIKYRGSQKVPLKHVYNYGKIRRRTMITIQRAHILVWRELAIIRAKIKGIWIKIDQLKAKRKL